jgi:glycosyltransferase involved in cell wall biosynthesis
MAYLWPFGIEPWVNATPYQRLKRLARRFDLTLFAPADAQVPEELLEGIAHVPVGALHSARWNRKLFFVFAGHAVLRAHRARPFDVLYTSHFPEMLAALRLRRKMRIPWAADIHDHPGLSAALVREASRFKALPHGFWERAQSSLLRRADLVVCGVGKPAVEACGIPQRKLLEVTNGVDLSATRPSAAVPTNGKPVVCYVGFVSGPRGAFTLIDACLDLAPRLGRLDLYLVGPCPPLERERIQARLNGSAGPLEVHVPGRRSHEEVLRQIAGSDACVFPFPSRPELDHIYPIKVYEYLAMGKPVVASDLPGIRTIIRHEENGLLFRDGDAEALGSALERVLRDGGLRSALARRARSSVEPFDWGRIHDRIADAVHRIIGESKH